MLTKIKFVGVIALAGLLLLGFARIKILATENERLTDKLATLEIANKGMAAELAANREALAAREAERARLSTETNELKFKLGEIYEKDTMAADWADAVCPADVLECLRR